MEVAAIHRFLWAAALYGTVATGMHGSMENTTTFPKGQKNSCLQTGARQQPINKGELAARHTRMLQPTGLREHLYCWTDKMFECKQASE